MKPTINALLKLDEAMKIVLNVGLPEDDKELRLTVGFIIAGLQAWFDVDCHSSEETYTTDDLARVHSLLVEAYQMEVLNSDKLGGLIEGAARAAYLVDGVRRAEPARNHHGDCIPGRLQEPPSDGGVR